MKDKTFDNFWEELKSESPETRKELEEAEKNSELIMDITVAVRNLLNEKDSEKWISVDYYLPNTGRDVLVYTDTRDVFRCRYNSVGKHWVRDGIFRVEDVTHWRELPMPPRMEKCAIQKQIPLADIEQYKTFKIGDVEFIVLEQLDGKTFCLTRDFIAENTRFDDNTNNLANASVLNHLDTFESKIAVEVGAENMCDFEIDLTTDDGLKDYGSITRKTGLLTDVQYREHSEGVEPYAVDDWWWLANAVSTPRRDTLYAVRGVIDGVMGSCSCDDYIGVRAVCVFKSNIFVSE